MTADFIVGPGYHAARERVALLDRSDRVRLEFTGPQAAATLNGLVTNDVLALKPGDGQYAAALTAKGKVIADVRVFARGESLLVDTGAATGPGLLAMLKKFVNPRFAKYRDVSAELGTIGVFGPDAAKAVAGIAGIEASIVAGLANFSHARGARGGGAVYVARTPEFGVAGFDIFVASDRAAEITRALGAAGATGLDASSAEVLRIEAGWPRYGVDFDENQLAQEIGLDRLGAISFDKGCYTGQETVVRVHFRGHVNRTLRGLRAAVALSGGSTLHDAEGAAVGDVRSAAHSPSLGHIALAYVRREVADGDVISARAPAGDAAADIDSVTVVPLPFDSRLAG